MHNQNNNASIWDLETLKREINECDLDFFSKYLTENSVLNNDIEFIKDELAFVQKEIDESFKDGLNKQYFQHIKSVILKYCKINGIAIAPNTVSKVKSMANNHIQKVLESLIDVLNKNSYGDIILRREINLETVKSELTFELDSYNLSPEFAILVLEGLVSHCKFYPNRFNLKEDWYLDHSDSITKNLEWFNDKNINVIAVIKEIINSYSVLLQNIEKPVWQSLIKLELHNKLLEIEAKIPDKITNWKLRNDLIGCAAFCQLLFDRKYFVQGSTNQKSVNSFSLSRYGTDITNQLYSAKRVERKVHKEKLKKYFI